MTVLLESQEPGSAAHVRKTDRGFQSRLELKGGGFVDFCLGSAEDVRELQLVCLEWLMGQRKLKPNNPDIKAHLEGLGVDSDDSTKGIKKAIKGAKKA